jgi:hypothetical protein
MNLNTGTKDYISNNVPPRVWDRWGWYNINTIWIPIKKAYLCLIGQVYVFYVGYVDKSSLHETFVHCNMLSKHHHHQQ